MGKVESIFDARRRAKFGCGFLSQRDVDELLEGKLIDSRRERFEKHQREGCAECLHLAAAIEQFRRVLDEGVLQIEADRFARSEHDLKRRLQEEFERTFADADRRKTPWGSEISTDDLEQIVAAGPDGPRADPDPEADDPEDD